MGQSPVLRQRRISLRLRARYGPQKGQSEDCPFSFSTEGERHDSDTDFINFIQWTIDHVGWPPCGDDCSRHVARRLSLRRMSGWNNLIEDIQTWTTTPSSWEISINRCSTGGELRYTTFMGWWTFDRNIYMGTVEKALRVPSLSCYHTLIILIAHYFKLCTCDYLD